ncbi:MAG: TIGR00730 family Rossman fold protein [Planctomycetota bacterium]|nr:MAG: TIGR00730 family Rossman fold protein [Planctomycetota bacterium]
MRRVCVYCGSSRNVAAKYTDAARALGRALAERGVGLVYGGGRFGMMGAVAEAVHEAGGAVTGVIPHDLARLEQPPTWLSDLHFVDTMHQRKALMIEMSDALVALPGGYGTLDEMFEALAWAQLAFHKHPCGMLNAGGYFDALLSFLDHAVAEGFIQPECRELLIVASEPAALLDCLANRPSPTASVWNLKPAT